MKQVRIGGKDYFLTKGYVEDPVLRESFYELPREAFGVDFQKWNEAGYGKVFHRPYCLFDGNRAAAGVCASILEFEYKGKRETYVQIGGVVTRREYQHMGLSRYLMEQVISDWEDQCSMIYLYANDSVTAFYPKFGFKEVQDYEYIRTTSETAQDNSAKVRKLDVENEKDLKRLITRIKKGNPYAALEVIREDVSLMMFYCMRYVKEMIYEIEDLGAVVIADYQGDVLEISDILSDGRAEMDEIIGRMERKGIKTIKLGFTPEKKEGYIARPIQEQDHTFFVRPGISETKEESHIFQSDEKLGFPVLSYT